MTDASVLSALQIGITDGAHSLSVPLNFKASEKTAHEYAVELPSSVCVLNKTDGSDGNEVCACVASDAFLTLTAHSIGTGSDGTMVTSISAQGIVPISQLLSDAAGSVPSLVGLTYGTVGAHALSVGFANVRITDAAQDVAAQRAAILTPSEVELTAVSEGEEALVSYWNRCSASREHALVYEQMPRLTKPIVRVPAGVMSIVTTDDGQRELSLSNFVPTFSLLSRSTPFSLPALESVLHAALLTECGGDADRMQTFLDDCKHPGSNATAQSVLASGALRNVANWFTGYRPDGRTMRNSEGAGVTFAVSEHWSDQAAFDLFNGDDCDGSALTTVAIASQLGIGNHARRDRSPDLTADSLRVSRAIRNALFFHVVGLCVVGATTASGADATEADTLKVNAGHAIALAIPIVQFLAATSNGDRTDVTAHIVASTPAEKRTLERTWLKGHEAKVSNAAEAARVNGLRARAFLPEWRRAQLSAQDQEKLSGASDSKLFDYLANKALLEVSHVHPIEGTAMMPTCGMFTADSVEYGALHTLETMRIRARKSVGPTIAKCIEDLAHVRKDGRHAFYGHLVEFVPGGVFTEDQTLINEGAALMQLAICQLDDSSKLQEMLGVSTRSICAGVPPEMLVTGNYRLIDEARMPPAEARALLKATQRAERHRAPPMALEATRLSPWEDANLVRSLKALVDLRTSVLSSERNLEYSPIELHLTPAMLARNPRSVEALVSSLKKACEEVDVDIMQIAHTTNRASTPEGGQIEAPEIETGVCVAVLTAWVPPK